MKFNYSGHRKKFKDNLNATISKQRQLGIKAECKDTNFYAVLAWRRKSPQYAFNGTLSSDSDFIIEGKIELVGTKWQWYDYLCAAFACILVMPFLFLTIIPGDPYGSAGRTIPFPFNFSGKKSQKKRLVRYMVEALHCEYIGDE